jgi:hypothetical protein
VVPERQGPITIFPLETFLTGVVPGTSLPQ